MTFMQALRELNIEDYGDRIFSSNSRGELFHMMDYINMANKFNDEAKAKFREHFVEIVKDAENTWDRPASIFQHIPKVLNYGKLGYTKETK